MFRSLGLGKFFGIDLYVHPTFWLLPLFVFASGSLGGDVSGALFEVAVVLAVFGCVALHEVGHALAARYYGIDTRDITLYPVGGVARLERMPTKPLQEIVIALAGPAVNVAIALGLVGGLAAREYLLPGSLASPGVADRFLGHLTVANLALVAFNLVPAFPMDGGRVFRAVLALGLPRVEATRLAVGLGAAVAVGFGLIGLGLVPNPLTGTTAAQPGLVLVAGVVYLLGQAELAGVKAEATRRRLPWAVPLDEVPADRFTGWRWDARRGVWGLYQDGVLVREVYAG
ncbi:MAG: site-2 protease family protein [Gemmataceae bacterium]|nr:site-2 protease family protein [Gemmataceae bacterium]